MFQSYTNKAYSQEMFFWVLMERCFPPAELEYVDDVNILVIHQKWNKGQCLSLPVTAGMGVNRCKIKHDISEVINNFTGEDKEITVHVHLIEINVSRNLLV